MPSLDVAINARKAQQGAREFDSSVRKVKRGARDIDKGIKSNEKSFKSLGAQMKTVVVGMIGMAAAYKGLRFAQTAVKDAAAFGMELANVSTMLDDQTMRYLPGYEDALSSLAVKYGQSTTTLSKGLYDILSASIKASDAIEVLNVASKAAIGGLTDTGSAADALTTIINAYGMEAEDAAKISGILFATVKRGKITFGELAGSIGKVIALAAAAGLSFEQASAAIATMTRAGISADIAMTALKAIVTTFLSPQREGIEMAKKFGLELNTNTLQTIGLTGALEKLKYATTEETAAIFSNVRALLGVAATRKSLNALIQDYAGMLKSLGMDEIAYQKIAATTQHQLERNRQLFKQIRRDIGEGIKPALDLWMAGFRPFIDEWKIGWSLMVQHMEESIELIRLRLIPTDANRNFVRSMLDADDAIKKFKTTTWELAAGLDKIEKMEIEIAPIDLDIGSIKKYSEEHIKAGLAITALFSELRAERELIGLTTEERERAIKLIEFEAHAKELLGDKSGEMVDLYKNELENIRDLYIEAEKTAEFYAKIGEGMEGLIRSPLTALLDETRDIEAVLKDELRNLATSVLEMMYEEVITKPLMDAIKAGAQPALNALSSMISNFVGGISRGITGGIGGMVGGALMSVVGGGLGGLFGGGGAAVAGGTTAQGFLPGSPVPGLGFSKGDVFSRGSITPFAKGDILTRPTIFPMSNGGVGLAGEAGNEAIMPLTRDKSGRLGVRAEGGEGRETTIKIINVMDQSQVQEYLGSGDGERQIVNVMRRNASEIREVVG